MHLQGHLAADTAKTEQREGRGPSTMASITSYSSQYYREHHTFKPDLVQLEMEVTVQIPIWWKNTSSADLVQLL